MGIEAGIGQKYGFSVNGIVIPTNAGAAMDILNILAAANIPIAIQRLYITSNLSSAQAVPVQVGICTAVGTGGSATGATLTPEPPSGTAASETMTTLNTTAGAGFVQADADFWQIFNGYEFLRKPGGLLIPPTKVFALRVPLGGVGTSFTASISGEYIAFK